MRSDGTEILATWRESGAWWSGERPLEVVRARKRSGRVVEEWTAYPAPWALPGAPSGEEYVEDHSEDYDLRVRKKRDEKVGRATGRIVDARTVGLRSVDRVYAPLHLYSGYSFGESILFAEEIPRRCATLGLPAAALVDLFSFAGVVEFVREARRCGVRPIIGATVEMETGGRLVLLVRSKRGYERLSKFLTKCHLSQPRGMPLATWQGLFESAGDWICLSGGDSGPLNPLLAARRLEEAELMVGKLTRCFGRECFYLEAERSYCPWQADVERRLVELSAHHGLKIVAGGALTHAHPREFPAQDVLVCAETLCLVDELVGRKASVSRLPRRAINAEKYIRNPDEMWKLYQDRPEWLEETLRVVESCDEDVLPSRTRMPRTGGNLTELVWAGAAENYPKITSSIRKRLNGELDRILSLNFSEHFLIAHDFCEYARENNIQYSARGSVVDSAVAYCLGLSRIDAIQHNLLFDRFLPEDGSKRPDIDIDFEARRRDEIRVYMEQKYGREHVSGIAAFGAFCVRGIIREVGKALGIPPAMISFLSKRVHGGVNPTQLESALAKRPELIKSGIPRERFSWVFHLAEMLTDVPRNLRAHSSGVIVSAEPIAHTVPVVHSASEQETGPLRIIQWDKRSAKYYFDKFDILCLRGQDVLSGTQQRLQSEVRVDQISTDDPNTYAAMRGGELIGIPQSASPAMRQAHVRIRTQDLTDASLVQAGIRPGVGGAVKMNELILRRRGLKPYSFEHPELERILGHTYGIVVFQEQIDELLQAFCRYSGGEAEEIREKIHKNRRSDYGVVIREELLQRMNRNGFDENVAKHVFDLVANYKGYGFAQGHALAFAEISIRSIYCQQNYPAEYFAALLSSQPAGYYGPCTLVNEARSRGIPILPLDINESTREFKVEDLRAKDDPQIWIPNAAIRIGWMQLRGLKEKTMEKILKKRPFWNFFDFCQKVRPSRDELEALVLSGAFDALHPHRKQLLWSIPEAGHEGALGMESQLSPIQPEDFHPVERSVMERTLLGLDIAHHLMAWERSRVQGKGGITSREAKDLADGEKAFVVGNPIRLRFPPTPSGKRVVFFDLEDEYGLLNITAFDRVYQKDGHAMICSPYVTVVGRAQDRDGYRAFLAERVFPYEPKQTLENLENSKIPIRFADYLVG